MQIIMIPTANYICSSCNNQLYFINPPREEAIKGIKIVKCVNPECKNKGKICKINPQIIEVEECVQQEAG